MARDRRTVPQVAGLAFLLSALAVGCGRSSTPLAEGQKSPNEESAAPVKDTGSKETSSKESALSESETPSSEKPKHPEAGQNVVGSESKTAPNSADEGSEKKEFTSAEATAPATSETIAKSEGSAGAGMESPPTATPSEAPKGTPSRMLLFLSDFPLVVDLHINVEGKPLENSFSDFIDGMLKNADTDQDGTPKWEEVREHPKFRYGSYGNTAFRGVNFKTVLDSYDINRDGIFDRDEAPRFLTQNAGGARAFSLRSQGSLGRPLTPETELFRLLDTDQDGAISEQEANEATLRLRMKDADSDEIVSAAELIQKTMDDGAGPEMSSPRATALEDTSKHIWTACHWNPIFTALDRLYAIRNVKSSRHTPLLAELLSQLDENHDGRLRAKEIEGLLNVEPHLVIEVNFDSTPKADEAPTVSPLRVLKVAPALQDDVTATLTENRLDVHVRGSVISIFARDLIARADYEAQAKGILAQFDKDQNGYLEESEIPPESPVVAPIEVVDTNGDSKLYPDEIAIYLADRNQARRVQVHAAETPRGDFLFAAIDLNQDERLDLGEMTQAKTSIMKCDRSGDQFVTEEEIPASYVMTIARGDLGDRNELFRIVSTRPNTVVRDAPLWFRKMDRNSDGFISPREFLGAPERFSKADANNDRLLSLEECASLSGN